MESPKLADRLRQMLTTPGANRPVPPARPVLPAGAARAALDAILGGTWRQVSGASCFVVERRWEAGALYGRGTMGEMAERIDAAGAGAPLLAGGTPACAPFVFFDLETTGLSGGAGTHAFLVGCGWFENDGAFLTRQFLLTRFSDERPLLAAVAGEFARAGALVSFNGKSFDAPVLETRYLFHRLEWIGQGLPHVDVLHPARRFWKRDPGHNDEHSDGNDERDERLESNCSLIALERRILGARRIGDVPGFEIPERYFQFLRSGDARPLAAVLEHNRLDLLSLAGLTARLLDLIHVGPAHASDAWEALALGRVYSAHAGRAGLKACATTDGPTQAGRKACATTDTTGTGFAARAIEAYERAVALSGGRSGVLVRCEALRSLAIACRRARRFDEAAERWQQMSALPGCPRPLVREANEALAVHHEHRVRDLARARVFALRCLENERHPALKQAGEHRLSRIERKLEEVPTPTARQPYFLS